MPTTIYGAQSGFSGDNSDASASHRELCTITAASLGYVRVTFRASAAGGIFATLHCSVGVSAGGAHADTTTATPVELTFAGAHGFSIAQGATIVSDWALLSFTSSDKLVVVFDTGATNNAFRSAPASAPQNTDDYFYAASATWNVANPGTATPAGGNDQAVDKIETNANNFGDVRGTLSGNGISITNPSDATGSVTVSVGDLIVGVLGQQSNLTSSGCTDNLGNTYTAQNAGTDAGTSTGRMWYSVATVGGTLTAVHFAATASANNFSCVAAVYAGLFTTPAIDANPANGASDIVTPFTCPATGVLSQASELIIGWAGASAAVVADWTASSGITRLDVQAVDSGAFILTVIGSTVVSSTASITPAFTGTAPSTDDVLGTASFKAAAAVLQTAFHSTDFNPRVVRIRPQAADLAFVPVLPRPAPIMARGDFEQNKIMKRMRLDPLLISPPFPPPPPPPVESWTFVTEQRPPIRILPQEDNLSTPPSPPLPVVVMPRMDEQPKTIKLRPQADNLAAPPFPRATGVTAMAWLLDQPISVKIRPQQDHLFDPPFPRATGVTSMPWQALESPTSVKIRQQQDSIAWSAFTPTAAAAAPTMAWADLNQPVPIKARFQEDNLASVPQLLLGPPIMPSVYDEAYTTKVFIYDSVVEPPQPPPVLPPTMAWLLDQPIPIKARAQQDNPSIVPPTAVIAPTMPWAFDQPIPIKLKVQFDQLSAALFVAPRLLVPLPSDQPTPIKARLLDNLTAAVQPFAAVVTPAPTMSWLFDQPIVIKMRPQSDNAATFPSPPPSPSIMPTVYDEAYTTNIFIYDSIVQAPFPPVSVAVPTMSWLFDQPIPVKIKPQRDILVAPPFPSPIPFFAPAAFQQMDQTVRIKVKPQADTISWTITPPPPPPPVTEIHYRQIGRHTSLSGAFVHH